MFTFDLNQPVKVSTSGETGVVKDRSAGEDVYLLRVKATNGQTRNVWVGESELKALNNHAEATA